MVAIARRLFERHVRVATYQPTYEIKGRNAYIKKEVNRNSHISVLESICFKWF